MSDGMSDAGQALTRLRDFCGQHGWDGEPALSALRPLLDKVREARQRIAELERNIESALDLCPHAIRVREGGGPENLAASLAVTFSKMRDRIEELEKLTKYNPLAEEIQRKKERIAELEAERDALRMESPNHWRQRYTAREAQLAEMRIAMAYAANGTDSAHRRIARMLSMLDEFAIPTEQPNEDVNHA